MNIKQYISKLTGVPISKEGMAAAAGQGNVKARNLQWSFFSISDIPHDLPDIMKHEIVDLI
jgi:hypothetical protein